MGFVHKSFDSHNIMTFSVDTDSKLDGDRHCTTTIKIKDDANTIWKADATTDYGGLRELSIELTGDSEAWMIIEGLRFLADEIVRQIEANNSK